MSYSSIQRPPVVVAAFGIAAGAKPFCAGQEYAETPGGEMSGVCCQDNTWNNGTYRALKEPISLLYHNEKRVRAALKLLLNPDATSSSGLETALWEAGATTPTSVAGFGMLRSALERAAYNYALISPRSRWKKRKGGPQSNCVEGGYYNVWVTRPIKANAELLAALENAMGGSLGAIWKQNVIELGDMGAAGALPPQLVAWRATARAVVDSVPGSKASANIGTMPARAQLVGLSGNTAAPSAWLKSFLDTYAYGWDRPMVIQAVKLQTTPTLSVSKFNVNVKLKSFLAEEESQGSEDSSLTDGQETTAGLSNGQKAAIGIGAVALVGLGAVLLRKKRR